MKKISIGIGLVTFVTLMMLMSVGSVMAADVDMTWSNVGDVNASVSNGESSAYLGVSAGATGGQFKATVGARVEVDSLDAGFNGDGSMTFQQYNDFYGCYGEGLFTATTEGQSGGVNIETRLNKEKTNINSANAQDSNPLLYATGDHKMTANAWHDDTDDRAFDSYCGESFSVSTDAVSGTGTTEFANGYNYQEGTAFSTFHDGLSADGIMEGGDSGFSYSIEFDK